MYIKSLYFFLLLPLSLWLPLAFGEASQGELEAKTSTEAGYCSLDCSTPQVSLREIMANLSDILNHSLDELEAENPLPPQALLEEEAEEHNGELRSSEEFSYADLLPRLEGRPSNRARPTSEEAKSRSSGEKLRDTVRTLRRLELYSDEDSRLVLERFKRLRYQRQLTETSRIRGTLDEDKIMLDYRRRF